MKKICLLLVSIVAVLCLAACEPKADNSLDAQIEDAQKQLEYAKERKAEADREYQETMDKLDEIDRMYEALSRAK